MRGESIEADAEDLVTVAPLLPMCIPHITLPPLQTLFPSFHFHFHFLVLDLVQYLVTEAQYALFSPLIVSTNFIQFHFLEYNFQ